MTPRSAIGLFRATGHPAHPAPVRRADEFYPTPPEPTRALIAAELARLRALGRIWEPAAGDGAMVRELQGAGLDVVASDLVDRGCGAEIRSFYGFGPNDAPARGAVTNPPFHECNTGAWITHAMDVLALEYMALLLPLNWMGSGTARGPLWDRLPPARVYVMRWRIDFTGQGASPVLNAWYVWDRTSQAETRLLMLDRDGDARQGALL